jgi:hypothetical protein
MTVISPACQSQSYVMTDSQLASLSGIHWSLLYNLGMDPIENTVSSVMASVFVAEETCLPHRYKRLKLGGGQAHDHSGDCTCVAT